MNKIARDWQRFDSLIDVEFGELSVNYQRLAQMGMERVPLWHEVQAAVQDAVESHKDGGTVLGSLALPETGGGRCLLYAGVTGGVLDVLLDDEIAAAAGAIILASRSDAKICYAIPRHLDPPTADGGYHAWNAVRRGEKFYFVDMAYHWIVTANPDVVGPKQFIVAEASTLDHHGIGYSAHEQFTRLVAPALTPGNLTPLIDRALTRLRSTLGPPTSP